MESNRIGEFWHVNPLGARWSGASGAIGGPEGNWVFQVHGDVGQQLWQQVWDTRARLEFPANALGAHSFHPWGRENKIYKYKE